MELQELTSVRCPFLEMSGHKVDCPYIDEKNHCDEIEVNPGNGDAWCYRMVDLGMGCVYPETE